MLDISLVTFYDWIFRLVAVSLLVQTLEYIYLMRDRFSRIILSINLLVLPIIFYFGSTPLILYPFLASIYLFYKWGRVFNGGSDHMTVIVLHVCLFQALLPRSAWIAEFGLWYLGLQVVLSYFIAGIAKIRLSQWRNGVAVRDFLKESNYAVPPLVLRFADKANITLLAGWSVVLFETTFPIALLSRTGFIVYLCVAAVFHFANFLVLGLNRFFFAWLAAYPAVYFVCLKLTAA